MERKAGGVPDNTLVRVTASHKPVGGPVRPLVVAVGGFRIVARLQTLETVCRFHPVGTLVGMFTVEVVVGTIISGLVSRFQSVDAVLHRIAMAFLLLTATLSWEVVGAFRSTVARL